MAFTRTDKTFIATVSLIAFFFGVAQFHRHMLGRTRGTGQVLEVEHVGSGHVNSVASSNPTGKAWQLVPVRWSMPEHYRIKVAIDGKERWIAVPLDRVEAFKDHRIELTYKEFPDGRFKVYRIHD